MKVDGEMNGEKWALNGAASFISSEQKIATDQDAFARINSTECAISFDWKAMEQINFGTAFRWIGPTQRAVSEAYEEVNQQSTEAYSWLDAHVQWSAPSGRWQFTATAKNLGDVTSIVSASNGSIHAPSSALMSWGRSFNFRLNYRIESRNDE
jgi:outer membrane receptor protein involved in Fe transport